MRSSNLDNCVFMCAISYAVIHNSRQVAINEAWQDAHLTFEREHGSAVRHLENTLLESTLNLSKEKKYVACARVISRYELSRER